MPHAPPWTASRFAEHLRTLDRYAEKPSYALFLGAGCSISSDIPAAESLVRDRWLPRLHREKAPASDFGGWVDTEYPEHKEKGFGGCYRTVINDLFPHVADRQREIESLCDGKIPGFGYAVLSHLIADRERNFKVVLTTNFDDLMADALYVFTDTKPLVISHESLIHFDTPTTAKPLIVKVSGDLRFFPKNTEEEIKGLKRDMADRIKSLIADRTLVFIGYGGHDPGVNEMLTTIRRGEHSLPIYWISRSEPECGLREWLDEHEAIWVKSDEEKGFDKLALLIKEKFGIPDPDEKRFQKVFDQYADTLLALKESVDDIPEANPEGEELKAAVAQASKSIPEWMFLAWAAGKLKKSDPARADALYQEALSFNSEKAALLGDYAVFLHKVRLNYDRAEEFYQKALKADPNHAHHLGDYAAFLDDIRQDHNRAEEFYRKALNADPNHANILGKYAFFLANIRQDHDRAEELYQKALKADPSHTNNLGNYAVFLADIRRDYDRAEEFYQKALKADPNHANNLGNYAEFLLVIRDDEKGALAYAVRMEEAAKAGAEPTLLVASLLTHLLAPTTRTLAAIRGLLAKGVRNKTWSLATVVSWLRKNEAQGADFVEALIKVVNDRAPLDSLDAWPEWKKAR
ncbi:MAG: SIR2 family protein [Nitrospinae bacterium]|nr:SIR2 family protein [Nitrospinota bacterium]